MAKRDELSILVAAERTAFAELIAGLGDADLEQDSLCTGWTVRDVACHVASGQALGVLGAIGGAVRSGFSTVRFNDRELQRWRGRELAEVIGTVEQTKLTGLLGLSPPGALTEIFLHQQDVRRPLGAVREYSPACLAAALDATVAVATGTGAKRRLRGLALRATDIAWTHGDGPEVTGPAEALILAANGRAAATDSLDGDGVATLRERLPTTN